MAFWDNFPKVFASIVPLSSMSLGATFGMVYNNKSLDDVVKDEVATRDREAQGELGDEMDFDIPDDLDDPDAVNKALFQAQQGPTGPGAFMTPYGPALSDEGVMAVLDENPAMKSLIGLDPLESEEVQQEAGNLLEQAGDFIEDLWHWGGDMAAEEGGDALEVAKGLFDTVAPYVTSAVDTSLAGQVIQSAQQTTMEQSYDDLLLMPPGQAMQTGVGAGVETEDEEDGEGWFQTIVGAVEDAVTTANDFGAFLPGGDPVGYVAEQRQMEQQRIPDLMDDALIPNAAEDYGATDNEILSDFFSMRMQGEISDDDLDLFLDRHPEFKTERKGLWDGMAGVKDIVSLHDSTPASWPGVPYREEAPFSLDLADYTPGVWQEWALLANYTHPPINPLFPVVVKEGDTKTPAEKAAAYTGGPDQTGVSLSGMGTGAALKGPLATEPNLTKVFHAVMAVVPGGNHPSVRAMSDELEAEAELMFWLWHGTYAHTALVQDGAAGDFTDVESYFRAFLSSDYKNPVTGEVTGDKIGYLWNPDVYRSGEQFLQKVAELKNLMALYAQEGAEMPGFETATPLLTLFGADDEDSYNRLAGLATLYVTGGHKGYMAQRIQNTMLRNMNYKDTKKGMTPTQAFAEATVSPSVGQPFSAPPSPQPEYDFSDIAALKASPAYNMGVGGIQRAMPAQPEYDFSDIKAVQDSLEYNLGAEEAKMWFPPLDPTALPATTASGGPGELEKSLTPAAWAAYLHYVSAEPKVLYAGAPSGVSEVTGKAITKAEHLASMPEPFDDDERVKRAKGLPYKQGRFDDAGNWVAGTHFVPTTGYEAEKQDATVRITSPEVVAANKAFFDKFYGGNQP